MENNDDNGAERTTTGSGISRGQNQLHLVPEDWSAAASVILPLTERLDDETDSTQMIVITGDVDAAAGLGSRLGPRLMESRPLRLLSATHPRRAIRMLRRAGAPAHLLIGTPELFAELLHVAALKLDGVRVAVLAWVDDLDTKGTKALEAVMTEVPKDAARVVIASHGTPAVEQLVERYARRARLLQPAAEGEETAVPLSYVAVGEVARPMALRRILDTLDPDSAFVVVGTPESRRQVDAQLGSLGYGGAESDVRSGNAPDRAAPAQLVILYDFPVSADHLRATAAAAGEARLVALATPRQLSTLRRWTAGAVTPLALPEAAVRARTREDAIRDEIRAALAAGAFSRELLALEPLLNEHDGIEVAAALLRMLELERARPASPAAAAPAVPAMTRVFVNVGEMDGVRLGDLVGAITNEAGISKADIGRVDIRERHSTVEVATPVANSVVSRVSGTSIRGRRALVKIDENRPSRRPSRPR